MCIGIYIYIYMYMCEFVYLYYFYTISIYIHMCIYTLSEGPRTHCLGSVVPTAIRVMILELETLNSG